jgi:hypothetical protein
MDNIMDNLPAISDDSLIAASLRKWSEAAQGAYAKEAERAVRWDLAKFSRWCADVRLSPMPAFPETVAAFIDFLAATTLAALLCCSASTIAAAENAFTLTLNDASVVTPHNVTVTAVRHAGSDALEVRQAGQIKVFDPDTFAYVPGLDFHDGTIEVDVAGSLLPSALPAARGFVGVAFRIDRLRK